ncbi:hypothetical protein, partial [Kitasatospora sp. NPDC057500]|uniref:hypothetical protein n=1 Tax=Kitasatospora sp. NPDC057500 TaxID=3346151 RepID=UPI00368C1E68
AVDADVEAEADEAADAADAGAPSPAIPAIHRTSARSSAVGGPPSAGTSRPVSAARRLSWADEATSRLSSR